MLCIIYNIISLPLVGRLGQLADGLFEGSHVLVVGKGPQVDVEILRRVPYELLGIVSGPARNQRLKVVLRKYGPDVELDCKRLIGYTEAELRAINIKDNTHAGEWDLDLLADWTADLTLDLGIDPKEAKKNPEEMTVKDMELIRYDRFGKGSLTYTL